jgi:hypothetical protein
MIAEKLAVREFKWSKKDIMVTQSIMDQDE